MLPADRRGSSCLRPAIAPDKQGQLNAALGVGISFEVEGPLIRLDTRRTCRQHHPVGSSGLNVGRGCYSLPPAACARLKSSLGMVWTLGRNGSTVNQHSHRDFDAIPLRLFGVENLPHASYAKT